MTQDVYMGRKAVDARVAEALEDALGEDHAVPRQVRVQPKRVYKR